MYNVWLRKKDNKLFHVIASIEDNILISRKGKVNIISKEDFDLEFKNTIYSEEIIDFKTSFLDNFNFNDLLEYRKYLNKI